MKFTNEQLWERFQKHYTEFPSIKLAIDISRMNFADDFFALMQGKMERAFKVMAELETGAEMPTEPGCGDPCHTKIAWSCFPGTLQQLLMESVGK